MARIEKYENEEKESLEIPVGNSVEEINLRKKIILDFYREWKQRNPTQRKYNVSLKEVCQHQKRIYYRDLLSSFKDLSFHVGRSPT